MKKLFIIPVIFFLGAIVSAFYEVLWMVVLFCSALLIVALHTQFTLMEIGYSLEDTPKKEDTKHIRPDHH